MVPSFFHQLRNERKIGYGLGMSPQRGIWATTGLVFWYSDITGMCPCSSNSSSLLTPTKHRLRLQMMELQAVAFLCAQRLLCPQGSHPRPVGMTRSGNFKGYLRRKPGVPRPVILLPNWIVLFRWHVCFLRAIVNSLVPCFSHIEKKYLLIKKEENVILFRPAC